MSENPISVLSDAECWARLDTQKVGRLATSVGGVVNLTPINYVADNGGIVFRTAAGSKLAGLVVNSSVVFEVDEFDDTEGWSVVVRGAARILERDAEIAAAEELPLRPLVPTPKPTFVRIDVEAVSGRAFLFGPEPLPDYS